MITQVAQETISAAKRPTVWGLTPAELHDRFWAARGVQVVRPGEQSEIVEGAELFLLMGPGLLTIYRLRQAVEKLSWLKPDVLRVRLSDNSREHGYQEVAVTDEQEPDRFIRFDRSYGTPDVRLNRVALTPDHGIARVWQSASDIHSGWRQVRELVPRSRRATIRLEGLTYDRQADQEVMQFVRDLVQIWKLPEVTIDRAKKDRPRVWADPDASVAAAATFLGPAWVGAGRSVDDHESVVGPAVLWDVPADRPNVETVRWSELEHTDVFDRPAAKTARLSLYRPVKRLFDIVASAVAIVCLLPLFPFIMLAVYIEDGWPIFFAHTRETLGGRDFPCLKFRSMRNDAEAVKAQLKESNGADGPQFFIENDPRLTRVGRFMRQYHIDELPQFFNVLTGHMSIVGPRPSPREENQYCPSWREARLSVRPGITGLWQVSRTRREGLDFQEWIRYDIEYVDNQSLLQDLRIIWKTVCLLTRGRG